MSTTDRPAKRIRQACENCRRKKSRCPGEKPACSYCHRLGQTCVYSDDLEQGASAGGVRNTNGSGIGAGTANGNGYAGRRPTISSTPEVEVPRARHLDDRLEMLEAQLAEVLGAVKQQSGSSRDIGSPARRDVIPQNTYQTPIDRTHQTHTNVLPPWEQVVAAAELYLAYCDCQPLPLFDRTTFISSLGSRNPEVLLAILAMSLRFSDNANMTGILSETIDGYADSARTLAMQRVSDGPVELSTLQTLCLLTLVDFTNGNTQRASIHSSLAMDLAHCAGLTSESPVRIPDVVREERRRCFWSIFLLKRLHGADFSVLDFSGEDNFPWYPNSTGKPSGANTFFDASSPSVNRNPGGDDKSDAGIIAYTIQLSEVWFKTTKYGRRRGKPSKLPPWSPQSEYATIMAQQMDFETRMPYMHRFKPADFSSKTSEELHQNRDYWGPWFFIQFLYHTNLCLLNHPLLLSLRLRNFTTVIPEIFLQHTSDLIASHAAWIIHFIDIMEAKSFKVTDPFLGHCAAIVATIYLQESFKEGDSLRKEKQLNFAKTLKFMRDIGEQWPHIARIADKLHRLSQTVSATYHTSNVSSSFQPDTPNRSLLIDLGRFWEILEYSSASDLPSGNNLFGASLYNGRDYEMHEVSSTSALPEPTRLGNASNADSVAPQSTHGTSRHGLDIRNSIGSVGEQPGGITTSGEQSSRLGVDSVSGGVQMQRIPSSHPGTFSMEPSQDMFLYSTDEMAVLAESFFQQRSGNIVGTVEDWWNTGNL